MLPTKKVSHVRIRDNQNLSPHEVQLAQSVRSLVVNLVDARESIVKTEGLDREFSIPAHNWQETPDSMIFREYRAVRDGDYQILNRLRFFSQAFTGYQLMTFRHAEHLPAVTRVPDEKLYDDWLGRRLARPDTWVYKWRDFTKDLPPELVISPPHKLGEVGWNVNGVVVSRDTYVYQERVNLLYESGVLSRLLEIAKRRPVRILEVGGGYGALARAISGIIKPLQYVICDIPESLIFSAIYLTTTLPEKSVTVEAHAERLSLAGEGIKLLANYSFPKMVEQAEQFDLVINTSSFSELSERQLKIYAQGIATCIGKDGLFYEQNLPIGVFGSINCKQVIAPYFPNWFRFVPQIMPATQGPPEFWSNRPFAEIIDRKYKPMIKKPTLITKSYRKARTAWWQLQNRLSKRAYSFDELNS